MLTAISAPPGSGKSLYCVQLLEETVRKNPNRMIFTNIIGINIQGVLPIVSSAHKPFDWRDLPDGSLIIYDEAHEHPAFAKTDLLKNYQLPQHVIDLYDSEVQKILNYSNLNSDEKVKLLKRHGFVYSSLPSALLVKQQEDLVRSVRSHQKIALEKAKEDILDIGRGLTMHRHWGFDIVLVTQKPDLLNAFVKAATSTHLILRRLFSWDLAIIYTYSEIQDSFGNATRKNALSWKIWFFPKRLFKYYISAEEHTSKSSIPWLIKLPVGLFLLLVVFSIYRAFSTDYGFFKNSSASSLEQVQEQTAPQAQAQQQTAPQAQAQQQTAPQADLSNLCRKAANVEMPECVEWFNNFTSDPQLSSYDSNDPYGFSYTPKVEPTDFPRMSGVIKLSSGKLIAIDQQGNYMKGISQNDCKRWLNGYRPFDYFAEQRQQNQEQKIDEDANYQRALRENIPRLEAEKMYKSENAQVTQEQIPLGSETRLITVANSL